MNRRGFLKACGIVGTSAAAALIIPPLRLLLPDQGLDPGESWLANARELVGYDIDKDSMIARWDIMAYHRLTKLWTLQYWPAHYKPGHLREMRGHAAAAMTKYLREKNIVPGDMKPLPIPYAYKEGPGIYRAEKEAIENGAKGFVWENRYIELC